MGRRDGFTLLELMIVVAVIAVLAATAIPSFVAAKIATNETSAIASLRTYASAQQMYRQVDYDKDSVLSYATPYTILYSTDVNGRPLELIPKDFADATQPGRSKSGYFFTDITQGAGGPFNINAEHGLSASPAYYGRTGRMSYIIETGGTVYMQDLGDNIPVVSWPAQPRAEGWAPHGG